MITSKTDLINKAVVIAAVAHHGQKRKNDGSPYVVHPFRVAMKLKNHNFKDEVIAAALVHDVLEDTEVTEKELRKQLGNKVVDLVMQLTEDKSKTWEERKTND